MNAPDFEVMSTVEDFERYFASTSDHSDFIRWMQHTGVSAPPPEIRVDLAETVSMEVTAVRLPRATIRRLDDSQATTRPVDQASSGSPLTSF